MNIVTKNIKNNNHIGSNRLFRQISYQKTILIIITIQSGYLIFLPPKQVVSIFAELMFLFGSPLFSYTTSVIPDWRLHYNFSTITQQGYNVVYSVHALTEGPPTTALYSACVTVILYDKCC